MLQSQREALAASALELAAVRRAAAVERNEPELEAAWLRTPPKGAPSKAHAGGGADGDEEPDWLRSASGVLSDERAHEAKRHEAYDEWRTEWLQAMAHSL